MEQLRQFRTKNYGQNEDAMPPVHSTMTTGSLRNFPTRDEMLRDFVKPIVGETVHLLHYLGCRVATDHVQTVPPAREVLGDKYHR